MVTWSPYQVHLLPVENRVRWGWESSHGDSRVDVRLLTRRQTATALQRIEVISRSVDLVIS